MTPGAEEVRPQDVWEPGPPVWSVAWSPDGTRIATGSADGTARLWDATTGDHQNILTGHTDWVLSVAWSPDGTRIATGSDDGTVRLWDATTGDHRTTLTGRTGAVLSVAWSPDGTRIATASDDGTARLWDATTGDHRTTLTGHTGAVLSVAWSPDGTRIATASADGTVRLWDATTGDHQNILTGHTDWVLSVAWSPDGTRIATASDDGTVRLWDATTGDHRTTLTGHTRWVRSVAWSPDGTRIATASDDGTARLWDATTGDHRTTLTGHTGAVLSVAWSPDGTRIATGSTDGTVRLWDATTGDHQTTLTGHTGKVRSVAWSPDGTRIATASTDGTVRLWDATTGDHRTTLTGHTDWVLSVAWSPDGTRIATASDDGTVRLWDATTGDHQTTLTGHTGKVRSVAWSPDGTRIATASTDGTVRLWDATTGDHRTTLTGHTDWVLSVAWSPDGTHIATASDDGTVRLWDATTGDHQTTLTGHTGKVRSVAWSPDGTRIATASTDGTVRLWDATTGDHRTTLTGHTGAVLSVAWSPDGTRIATGSADGTVRLWDATTGDHQNILTGHTDWVLSVAWSPDGTRIATASDDGTVRLWDATTGQPLRTVHDPTIVGPPPPPAPTIPPGDDPSAVLPHLSEPVSQLSLQSIVSLDDLTTADEFGRAALAGHLRGVIDQVLDSDQALEGSVINVDGRWGAGKTVLARLTLERLSEAPGSGDFRGPPVTVWFDSWRESNQAPHWWALASALRSGIARERSWATRGTMVVAGALRRLWRSSAVRSTAWALLIALLLWPALPDGGALDTAKSWIEALTAVVLAVYLISRFFFWFSPTLGQLHERTDANPLGEVTAMVQDLRRWSPRDDGRTQGRDTALAFGLLLAGALMARELTSTIGQSTVSEAWQWFRPWLAPVGIALIAALLVASTVVVPRTTAAPPKPPPRWQRSWPETNWGRVGLGCAVFIIVLGLSVVPSVSSWGADWPTWLGHPPGSLLPGILLTVAALGAYASSIRRSLALPRRPVVLVLDELDRCSAETVAAYLETVQTLLRTPERDRRPHSPNRSPSGLTPWERWRQPAPLVVLVLADSRWIRRSFSTRYDDFAELGTPTRSLGADFLQKLFDHTVLVPALSTEQTADAARLATTPISGPSAARGTTRREASKPASVVRPTTFAEPATQLPAPISSADEASDSGDQQSSASTSIDISAPLITPNFAEDIERAAREAEDAASVANLKERIRHLVEDYASILPANPRLIRRVANSWGMLRTIRQHLGTEQSANVSDDALIRAAVLYVAFPDVIDALLDAPTPPQLELDPASDVLWARPDVLHVLRQSDGTYLDTSTLAACFGHRFPPTPK